MSVLLGCIGPMNWLLHLDAIYYWNWKHVLLLERNLVHKTVLMLYSQLFQDSWNRHKLTLLVKPWRTLRHCTYLFPRVVMSKNIFGCSHGRIALCIVNSLTLQHGRLYWLVPQSSSSPKVTNWLPGITEPDSLASIPIMFMSQLWTVLIAQLFLHKYLPHILVNFCFYRGISSCHINFVSCNDMDITVLRFPWPISQLCQKHLWGYIVPWVGNLSEKNYLYVELNLQYHNFCSHCIWKIDSSNFLMMM